MRPDPGMLVVVYLTGELGAGKTTFARGFLSELGVEGAVRSPTYTLLELQELEGVTALHIDLYRLHDASELDSLGLREWARPGIVWLIEWPQHAAARLPAPDLEIFLQVSTAEHTLTLRAPSTLGAEWLHRAVALLPQTL